MATVPQAQEELAPVPFFTDIRTLSQKLVADKREWRPTEPEFDCPNMIFGLVLKLGEYYGKYREEPAPTMQLLTEDNIVWSVIGFHGYLRSEFARKQPQVGDFAAVAYLGTKRAKVGESEPNVYQMEVERNPAPTPVLVPTDESEPRIRRRRSTTRILRSDGRH